MEGESCLAVYSQPILNEREVDGLVMHANVKR